jgi:hypothetical protein
VTRVQDETRRGAPPPTGDNWVVTAAAYLALFLVGAIEALIGTFQYSRGPGILVAICFALGILVTSLLGGWGMGSSAGGLAPSAGWFLVAIVLGLSSSGGSVLVTATHQGEWFLFGGAVCAAAGVIIAFVLWGPGRKRPGSAR